MSKFRLDLIFASFFFFVLGCEEIGDSYGSLVENIKTTKLKNGLTLVAVPDKNSNAISLQTWVKAGTLHEPRGSSGVSSLAYRIFSSRNYGEFIGKIGGISGGGTSRDYTWYHSTFPSEFLEKVLSLEKERHLAIRKEISIEELRTELAYLFEERRLRALTDTEDATEQALWSQAFKIHPYGVPLGGFPEEILGLNPAKFKAFIEAGYSARSLILVAVGNVTDSAFFELAKKYLGEIPDSSASPKPVLQEPKQFGERVLKVSAPISKPEYYGGYRIPAAGTKAAYAMDVLSGLLFEGNASKAHQILVNQKYVFHEFRAMPYTPRDPGLLVIRAKSASSTLTLESAQKEIDWLISDFLNSPPAKSEVDSAIKRVLNQILSGAQSQHGLAHLFGILSIYLESPKRILNEFQTYHSITYEDLQKAAAEYLEPNNRTVIWISAKKEEKK